MINVTMAVRTVESLVFLGDFCPPRAIWQYLEKFVIVDSRESRGGVWYWHPSDGGQGCY